MFDLDRRRGAPTRILLDRGGVSRGAVGPPRRAGPAAPYFPFRPCLFTGSTRGIAASSSRPKRARTTSTSSTGAPDNRAAARTVMPSARAMSALPKPAFCASEAPARRARFASGARPRNATGAANAAAAAETIRVVPTARRTSGVARTMAARGSSTDGIMSSSGKRGNASAKRNLMPGTVRAPTTSAKQEPVQVAG